jgi:hypothetical protein
MLLRPFPKRKRKKEKKKMLFTPHQEFTFKIVKINSRTFSDPPPTFTCVIKRKH